MPGYRSCVDPKTGELLPRTELCKFVENFDDAYDVIAEMYYMIQKLAGSGREIQESIGEACWGRAVKESELRAMAVVD